MFVRHPVETILLKAGRHDRWLGAGLHRARPMAGDAGATPFASGGLAGGLAVNLEREENVSRETIRETIAPLTSNDLVRRGPGR